MLFREHHSSNLSFGWSDGGRATNFLEDLGADAPATVTLAEFGMCAGHGVRSPTSSKVQEAGPSHGLGRGRSSASQPWRLPGVSLACWARGRCRDCPASHFSKLQRLGLRLIVVLMRLIVVLMRLIVVLMRLKYQCMPSDPGTLVASKQPNYSWYFSRIKTTKR